MLWCDIWVLPDIKANEVDIAENVVTTDDHAQVCDEEILSIKVLSHYTQ